MSGPPQSRPEPPDAPDALETPEALDARDTSEGDAPFVDAEAWLSRRGVQREPIRVAPPPAPDEDAAPGSPHEVARLAEEAAPAPPARPDAQDRTGDADEAVGQPGDTARAGGHAGRLEDDVAEALAYVRSATAGTPMSEGRLARRLAERDHPRVVVDLVLERARDAGLVDDRALAGALVAEWREKGHAPRRIRADLERRELDAAVVREVLADLDHGDVEAAAFDLARQRAARFGHLDAEVAFRRTVGFLARRGYSEGLARKAARQAVFADREDERTAGR